MATTVAEKGECLEIPNVNQGVSALFQILAIRNGDAIVTKKRKINLLDEDNAHAKINMSLSVKKIPHIRGRRVMRIHLPHPISSKAIRICLLVKDLKLKKSDNEETQLHYKEFLASKDIDFISEVISLHQLRTEYQTYESKRKLCQAYDLFIADRRVECYLPDMLGKEFYLKKKLPPKVNMLGKDLKQKFEEIRDSTYLYLHEQGANYSVQIGLTTQLEEYIVANILAVADMLRRFLPGGWVNVSELHISTQATMPIPLYISFVSAKKVALKAAYKMPNEPLIDELATVRTGLVAVFPDGTTMPVKNRQQVLKRYSKRKQLKK